MRGGGVPDDPAMAEDGQDHALVAGTNEQVRAMNQRTILERRASACPTGTRPASPRCPTA